MASKPKIPKSVEVGPHKIKVILDSSIDEYGHFVYNDLIIRVHPKLAASVQEETFWHEVVEAINIVHELKLPHRTIQILGAAFLHAAKTAK